MTHAPTIGRIGHDPTKGRRCTERIGPGSGTRCTAFACTGDEMCVGHRKSRRAKGVE